MVPKVLVGCVLFALWAGVALWVGTLIARTPDARPMRPGLFGLYWCVMGLVAGVATAFARAWYQARPVEPFGFQSTLTALWFALVGTGAEAARARQRWRASGG